MGMAASQARFLSLTARKSNVEYEGQQVNQQRTALANESANLYNKLTSIDVPTPPTTSDYYETVYTFTTSELDSTSQSGSTEYTLNSIYTMPDGTYANSGKGFGWQYRYIPLSLSTPKNVKISVGLSIAANQRANVGEITLLGRFYSRKVASGDYGTICLPYEVDMESVSGVDKVYSVSSMTNDLATLTLVEAMEAGKPYIFKASADEVVIPAKVGGAVVGTPQEDTYLVGTFADIDKMDYGTYVLSGNKFCKVVEGNEGDAVTLDAYRCYFKPLANGIKNFGFVEDDGETTGIDKIESEVDMKNAVIYDLTDRRVTSPVKGIYIVNGKKMVIDNLK